MPNRLSSSNSHYWKRWQVRGSDVMMTVYFWRGVIRIQFQRRPAREAYSMESDAWPRSHLYRRVYIKSNDGSTIHGRGDACKGTSVSTTNCSVRPLSRRWRILSALWRAAWNSGINLSITVRAREIPILCGSSKITGTSSFASDVDEQEFFQTTTVSPHFVRIRTRARMRTTPFKDIQTATAFPTKLLAEICSAFGSKRISNAWLRIVKA